MRPFILISLLLTFQAIAAVQSPKVLGFQEWKQAEVEVMQKKVAVSEKALVDLIAKEFINAEDLVADRMKLEQELTECRLNLEVVRELSVNDYFVLYLSRFSDKRAAFVSAAKKLAPDELAELMLAYDSNLSATRGSELMGELKAEASDAPAL